MVLRAMSVSYCPNIDHPRFEPCCDSLRVCQLKQIPIILIDGSPPDVGQKFRRIAGDQLFLFREKDTDKNNLTAHRRRGFDFLSQALKRDEVGFWTELEKPDLFRSAHTIATDMAASGAFACLPERDEMAMKTLPEIQQTTERIGNEIISRIVRILLDWFHGPKFGSKEAIRCHAAYDGEDTDGWGILVIPIIQMIIEGKKVTGHRYPYVHHPALRDEENRNPELAFVKRPRQLAELTRLVFDYLVKAGKIMKSEHKTL